MVEFVNCRLALELDPQSLLLHFHGSRQGATVRASEIKPKLDAFLLKKLQKKTGLSPKALKEDPQYRALFLDGYNMFSFRYRMQVRLEDGSIPFVVTDYWLISYSNRNSSETLYGLVCFAKVIIHCFIEPLRELIAEYIEEFFLVKSFGSRQGKGFGSFLPTSCALPMELSLEDEKRIAELLLEENGGKRGKCYCMRFPGHDESAGFRTREGYGYLMYRQIADFYLLMRTGQNKPGDYVHSYLFQYMHKKGIDNEKAWMKEKGLVPSLVNPKRPVVRPEPVGNPRLLKMLLGGSLHYYYWNKLVEKNRNGETVYEPSYDRKNDLVTVSIKNITQNRDRIDNVPSPIKFKIVRNVVFIYAADIPEYVYGAEFEFIKNGVRYGRLRTPSADEFDIQDFLDSYVEYYNGELRQKISNIADNKFVKKAGEADE